MRATGTCESNGNGRTLIIRSDTLDNLQKLLKPLYVDDSLCETMIPGLTVRLVEGDPMAVEIRGEIVQ